MGDIRPDNGGAVPPEDGGAHVEGLPALPPEWGPIPDDASELDTEAAAVRRELRLAAWGAGVRPGRRGLATAAGTAAGGDAPAPLAVPVAIMVVAVLTTLVSLWAVLLSRGPVPAVPDPTLTSASTGGAAAPPASIGSLREVGLVDPAGGSVRLGTLLPAVILLIDGCDCPDLVLDVARATPAGVTVVALAATPPVIYGAPTHVRSLAASGDSPLRTRYAAGVSAPADSATVIIINRLGVVVAVIPGAESAADVVPIGPL